jgi:hypothetical protein
MYIDGTVKSNGQPDQPVHLSFNAPTSGTYTWHLTILSQSYTASVDSSGNRLTVTNNNYPSCSNTANRISNNHLSGGAIAGIVIGALVGVGLIILAIYCYRKRKHSAKSVENSSIQEQLVDSSSDSSTPYAPLSLSNTTVSINPVFASSSSGRGSGVGLCAAITLLVYSAIFLSIFAYLTKEINEFRHTQASSFVANLFQGYGDTINTIFNVFLAITIIFALETGLCLYILFLECCSRNLCCQVSLFTAWVLLVLFQIPSFLLFLAFFIIVAKNCSGSNASCAGGLWALVAIPFSISFLLLSCSCYSMIRVRPRSNANAIDATLKPVVLV